MSIHDIPLNLLEILSEDVHLVNNSKKKVEMANGYEETKCYNHKQVRRPHYIKLTGPYCI